MFQSFLCFFPCTSLICPHPLFLCYHGESQINIILALRVEKLEESARALALSHVSGNARAFAVLNLDVVSTLRFGPSDKKF